MSSNDSVVIEVPEVWDRVTTGDTVALRLVVRRPSEESGIVRILNVGHRTSEFVHVDTDFFQSEIALSPGESYAITFGVRFLVPGPTNLSAFFLEVKPESGNSRIIGVPDRTIQVVPSLGREMEIRVDRICGYTQGVKLEVFVRHVGGASGTTWEDFEVSIGPQDHSRAGVTNHRRPTFAPADPEERIETVVAGQTVDITLAGTANGERVTFEHRQGIPAGNEGPGEFVPFTFLNPRGMTTDRITMNQDGGAEVKKSQGLFPVIGGGTQYLVKIKPHTHSRGVNLLSVKGQVEVEPMNSQGQEREFQVTIVDNPLFTWPVRLYYDVLTPGDDLRGELYLLVRPTGSKLWILALTAGTAITIKGFTAVIPTILHPDHKDEWLSRIPELLEKQWPDWLQLLSVPLIRIGLGLLDRLLRLFRGI